MASILVFSWASSADKYASKQASKQTELPITVKAVSK